MSRGAHFVTWDLQRGLRTSGFAREPARGPLDRRRCRRLTTTDKTERIHPGEVLMEDFIEGFGITQNQLAVSIGVPGSVVQRDRSRQVRDRSGHCAATGEVLRYVGGAVDQSAESLRVRSCRGSSRGADLFDHPVEDRVTVHLIVISGLTAAMTPAAAVERIGQEVVALRVSQNEFVRRSLEQGGSPPGAAAFTADGWSRSAAVLGDLADPAVMDDAWR